MARRKYRHSQKKNTHNQRSYKEYLSNSRAPLTTRNELLRLIRGGEDTYLELKLKLSNPEKIAQEIVAIANAANGTIIFGVSDQLRVEGLRNPEGVQEELVRICREEIYPPLVPYLDTIAFDNGSRIVALDVVGKNRPYRTKDGRFFLRIGAEKREATRNELSKLLDEVRPLFYENIPIPGIDKDDFDDGMLWDFARGFEMESGSANGYDTESFLKRDLLLAIGKNGEFLPTVAGVLLFGKDETVGEYYPQSRVMLERYSGNDTAADLVERVTVSGNLLSIYEQVLDFVERYCDLFKHRSKKRASTDEDPVAKRGSYHLYSIREAIVNLLTHRDLALRENETKITVFDDSIEIQNPRRTGGFTPPASKAIRFGITQRLNPQIAAIFSRREYGAHIPQGGLPMILRQSELFSGKRVELLTGNDQFRLKIYSA